MAKKTETLTGRERKFAMEYVSNGGNATAAYRAAYSTDRMKDMTISRRAVEVKDRPKVAAEIERLRAETKKRWRLEIDRVLEELAYIATLDPSDIFNDDWTPKPLSEVPEHARRAISAIKKKEASGATMEETVEVKLIDKNAALEKFMKYLGAYEKDNAQKITQITVKVEE